MTHFRPTEAQRLLVGVAREFLDKVCPLAVAQEFAAQGGGLPEDVWHQMSALGWSGLLIPARLGGSEGSMLDVALLLEEMGRAALPGPYVSSAVVATVLILRGATPVQQAQLLPRMATGEQRCTLAVLETEGSVEPATLRLTGEVGARMRGTKRFVRDADSARHLIVVARAGEGVNLVHVELARDPDGRLRPDVALEPLDTLTGERVHDVTLVDLPVTAASLIGAAGAGWSAVESAVAAGAVARAAEMVGAAQRILELTVEHAKVRVQSGRPIGGFQAVQHACADLLRDVEVARGVVHHAAWSLDTGRDAAAAVATAKAYAARACLAVARRAHQVFGALGYSAEHPLHLLHKRIHAASVDCGDRLEHLEAVARTLGLDG